MIQGDQRLLHDSLVRAAAAHGGTTAVAAQGLRCTYDEFLDSALRLARAFQDLGLERGDRVALFMPNSVPCAVSIFGVLMAGGVFIVVNPETKEDKLAYILDHSEASFLVTEGELRHVADSVVPHARTLKSVICAAPGDAGGSVLDLDQVIGGSSATPSSTGTIPLDLAALIYTSGTTGTPKGVMMTHQNLTYLAGSISEYLRLGPDDRILSVLSLAHTYGLSQLIVAVRLGASLFLERSFAYLAPVQQLIATESVTTFPGVPTVFAMLLSMHEKRPLELPSVTRVTCAGGALLPSFLTGIREIFPNALIFPMYGLTECMRVCYLEPELVAERPSSCGKAIPGSEVMILSPEGEPVPPGEIGVLHVRGPHVMVGYRGEPELTAHMLKEGPVPGERMLCTQDNFRMDEDGFLYFVGRSDEIIKTRGEKVSPVEVENVLHGIRGVREAAVVGVPDTLFGEAVRAFVALEEGSDLTPREIIAACRELLESFMVPKDVVLMQELPKTATGKITKRALRELQIAPSHV
jgi:acyl-CoA synthetase (AMP-forming)/AMP-acid ligase II